MCFLKILWHIWFCRKLDILVNLHVLKCLCDKSVFVFQMAWCQFSVRVITLPCPGIILCMRPANERQCYIVTSPLIGWAHTQNDPCMSRQTVSLGVCQGESREGWLEGPPASYRYGSQSDHQSVCIEASLVIWLCVWEPVWSSGCMYGSQSGHQCVCMGASLVIWLCVWEPVWSSGCVYGSQFGHQCVHMGASLVIWLYVWEPVWLPGCVYGSQSDHLLYESQSGLLVVCMGASLVIWLCMVASLVIWLCVWEPVWTSVCAYGLTVQIALPTTCRFWQHNIEPCLTPENLHQIFSFWSHLKANCM